MPGLDGMRALAVVTVMIYHANSSWLKGGFLGVEVFFVISGYLITLLLISETRAQIDSVDMKQFWIRRARRLLPGAVRDAVPAHDLDRALRTVDASASCAVTSSPRSPTARTGTRCTPARGTPRRTTSPRYATCGAWRWRSSST